MTAIHVNSELFLILSMKLILDDTCRLVKFFDQGMGADQKT